MSEKVQSRIRQLIDLQLYDSANIQCGLAVSSKSFSNAELVSIYESSGDAYCGKGEYRRAVSTYNAAFAHSHLRSGADAKLSSFRPTKIENKIQANLKAKEANCFTLIREHASALKCLESIPASLRTIDINISLAKAYKAVGLRRQAAALQLDILRAVPSSFELIEDLMSMNVSASDVLAAVVEGSRGEGQKVAKNTRNSAKNSKQAQFALDAAVSASLSLDQDELQLAKLLIGALDAKHQLDYDGSRRLFDKLLQQLPGNAFILRHAAESAALMGTGVAAGHSQQQAMLLYRQLHSAEPGSTVGMDLWGLLMYEQGLEGELGKLVAEVMALDTALLTASSAASSLAVPGAGAGAGGGCSIHASRPEGWLLAAMFAALKGDATRTNFFIDKALAVNPKYYLTYLFKGKFLLFHNHHEAAVVALMQANSLFKTIMGFSALIEAQQGMHNMREAGHVAREAVMVFSKIPEPLVMLSRVLMAVAAKAKEDEGGNCAEATKKLDEALKVLDRALKMDPSHQNASAYKADILMEKKEVHEAIACLRKGLQYCSSPIMRCKLGKALGSIGQFEEAVHILHLAVSLDIDNKTGAAAELEKLENKMRLHELAKNNAAGTAGMEMNMSASYHSGSGGTPASPYDYNAAASGVMQQSASGFARVDGSSGTDSSHRIFSSGGEPASAAASASSVRAFPVIQQALRYEHDGAYLNSDDEAKAEDPNDVGLIGEDDDDELGAQGGLGGLIFASSAGSTRGSDIMMRGASAQSAFSAGEDSARDHRRRRRSSSGDGEASGNAMDQHASGGRGYGAFYDCEEEEEAYYEDDDDDADNNGMGGGGVEDSDVE